MLRAVDANLNRLGEGLRVLEDIARFALNDPRLTREFRDLRRGLTGLDPLRAAKLLASRDVPSDVGVEREERERPDIISLARANARRCQEALRVLEECSRLPDIPMSESQCRNARFKLYELEKELFLKLLRQERRQRVRGLYFILDTGFLKGGDELEAAEKAIRGGARIIQLRDKHRDRGELLELALRLKDLCSRKGVLFLVNDHLDIALAGEADGLHIGQKDLPLTVARRLLPQDRIIGVSTHSLEQALKAQAEGSDYIAVGAVFPTSTKEGAVAVGPETLRRIREAVSLPVVAIGGINRDNVAQVMAAGAEAAAVISAILGAPDIEKATREMIDAIERKGEG